MRVLEINVGKRGRAAWGNGGGFMGKRGRIFDKSRMNTGDISFCIK